MVALVSLSLILAIGGGALVAYGSNRSKRFEDVRRRVNILAARIQRNTIHDARLASSERRSPLRKFLFRTLLGIDSRSYWLRRVSIPLICVSGSTSALATFAIGYGLGIPMPAVVSLAVFMSILGIRFGISMRRRRDETTLVDLFPEGIDMIVRMLRAGLPISSAISGAARELRPPVSMVLQSVSDQLLIGVPLEDALAETADRLQLSDFRFFSVAISLQRATGGNLASTLVTMSELLRKRKSMRLKARATSAEVRVSAIILGVLPLVVALGMFAVAPDYVLLLARDPRGQMLLATAAMFLLVGAASIQLILRRTLKV